ncbi:MAG: two-component system response regulator [Promethearchaeota archaeon]
MVRVNVNVSDETKKSWDDFVDTSNFSTLSKLVRESVNKYIEASKNSGDIKNLSKFSHKLKEELSTIKLASQMLIEEFKDKLNFADLKNINLIYEKSVNIEKLLNMAFGLEEVDKDSYDVLIVDDDKATIELLSDFFKKKGFSTKTKSTANETLNFLKYSKPKLILLDIILPDKNGYEVSKIIKKNNDLRDIPLYFITAVPKRELDENFNESCANGYILKPFDMIEFENLLNLL